DPPPATPAYHEAHAPVKQRGQPVLEPDEVDEVDGQPHQPGGEPAEPEPADAGNRAEARDRRYAALVVVLEGLAIRGPGQSGLDLTGHMTAALDRDLSDPRKPVQGD